MMDFILNMMDLSATVEMMDIPLETIDFTHNVILMKR